MYGLVAWVVHGLGIVQQVDRPQEHAPAGVKLLFGVVELLAELVMLLPDGCHLGS
jgi:hypothetical protein